MHDDGCTVGSRSALLHNVAVQLAGLVAARQTVLYHASVVLYSQSRAAQSAV